MGSKYNVIISEPAQLDIDDVSYHKLVVENYVVFYLIYEDKKEVRVIRVFDGRTDYLI